MSVRLVPSVRQARVPSVRQARVPSVRVMVPAPGPVSLSSYYMVPYTRPGYTRPCTIPRYTRHAPHHVHCHGILHVDGMLYMTVLMVRRSDGGTVIPRVR